MIPFPGYDDASSYATLHRSTNFQGAFSSLFFSSETINKINSRIIKTAEATYSIYERLLNNHNNINYINMKYPVMHTCQNTYIQYIKIT